MSEKLFIVTALFLLVLALDVTSGTFCDDGLPGRYCFKDLSGWYECTIDPKTQQMTQKLHACPANTRCQCFYDQDCPSSVKDPCDKYELPPPFPEVFSTFYTTIVTSCDGKGCTNFTNIGEFLQNATAGEQRHDHVGPGTWETTFTFPFEYIENNDFIQFDVSWFEKNCSLNSLSVFHRLAVPPYFTCYGLLPFKVCEWRSGGHSKTEEVFVEKWLLQTLPDGRFIPYLHELQWRPTPASNHTEFHDTMYPSFFTDFLDSSQLSMPTFCGHDLAASMTSRARENEPGAIKPPKIARERAEGNEAYNIAALYAKRGLHVPRKEE